MYFSFIMLSCLLFLFQTVSANTLWEAYGNNIQATRFSTVSDITKDNLNNLQVSWSATLPYSTGRTVVPIVTDDGSGTGKAVMIFCTDKNILYAIDPTTGVDVWTQTKFTNRITTWGYYCRGVSTWTNPTKNVGALCKQTVFMGTKDLTIVAVDAATGTPCDFGNNGVVQCFEPPLGHDIQDLFNINVKGPPIVVDGVVAVSPSVLDGLQQDTPKGPTWAFDAVTGNRLWSYSAIPLNSSDSAYSTWNGTEKVGGGNAWGMMSGHEGLGMIFMPIGSASTDYYGGLRPGANKNTSGIVAVKAKTGEVVWSYQIVHHDIWDYDLACQPTVTNIGVNGTGHGGRPVVVFGTKTSFVFVLDAATGISLYDVEEMAVPMSNVPGEYTYPTQPIPKNRNFTFAPLIVDESLLWGSNDAELQSCKQIYNNLTGKQEGKLFTPPSLGGSIIFPGTNGGIGFYGCTINPEKGIFICHAFNFGYVVTLLTQNESYPIWCDPYTHAPMSDTPYKFCMREFRSEVNHNLFCTKPPWKFMVAINIISGELLWKVPLGWNLESFYQKEWGDANQDGGLIMTASDLIFVSGTSDNMLHIFDATNGNLILSKNLPSKGNTPITYKIGNTQYVCVVPVPGNEIITFALSTSNSNPDNHISAIIGGSIAGAIIVIIILAACVVRRKVSRREGEPLILT